MVLKQVIVVRSDLKMGKGKLCAQVAHASLSAALKSRYLNEWLTQGQMKVVLKCSSLEELLDIYDKAKHSSLPAELVSDAGRTQIPAGTLTCIGIGPAPEEELNPITGKLKLL